MQKLDSLAERITRRIGVNLKRFDFDAGPYLRGCFSIPQLSKFYAFYGVTDLHPIYFHFSNSSLAGSYFLGKCKVDHSILYKTDIRGDELKSKGESIQHRGAKLVLEQDELISVSDSFLINTLVHNHSHDPENPEVFVIKNSAACPYANIHGAPVEGCFLGAFATWTSPPLVDAIEVYNSRCWSPAFNRQAKEFAEQHHIAGTVGSDAHAAFELG